MALTKALDYAGQLIKERVKTGDIVVDATCGNGYDTLFLAQLVGDTGKVYGFDIQVSAIKNTSERIKLAGFENRVTLLHESHGHVKYFIDNPIKAAMFNLGFLPGSDKQITTTHTSTIESIETLIKLLVIGGIITIVVYVGHDNGHEAYELEKFLSSLDQKVFNVLKYQFINQVNNPPYLIVLEKLK